jgi:hypothetical protein
MDSRRRLNQLEVGAAASISRPDTKPAPTLLTGSVRTCGNQVQAGPSFCRR